MAVLVMAGNLWALLLYYWMENVWIRSDLRTAAARVASEYQPGDVVVHSSAFSYRPFQFYLSDALPQGLARVSEDQPTLARVIGRGQLADDARRLWLVLWPDFRQPGFHQRVMAWMNTHHRLVQVVHESPQLFVALYERGAGPVMPPSW